MEVPAGQEVDHINGDKLDCRRANLRLAVRSENMFNRGKAKHNTSGFKGVHFCRQTGKWRGECRAFNRRHKTRRYETPEAAARAYDDLARRLHGKFARVNFCD